MVSKKIFVTGILFLVLLGFAAADMRIFIQGNSGAYVDAGNVVYTKDTDAAKQIYEAGLEKNPEDSHLLNNLAMVAKDQQRLMDAETLWNKAIAINPTDEIPRQNLAKFFFENKRYEEAASELRELISLDSKNPSYHYDLAINLVELLKAQGLDTFDEAIFHFSEAESLSPGYERALENIEVLQKIRANI